MFNNIGGKLKSLASICAWVGIILSVLSGLGCFVLSAGVGLVVMVVGSLASWAGSFVTYGLGQLIENTDKLVAASKD